MFKEPKPRKSRLTNICSSFQVKLHNLLRHHNLVVSTALQSGLEFRTFEYRIHSITKRFKVRFSNGKKTKWRPFCSVFEWSGPFEYRTMVSLGRFIYINKFNLYIKRPSLERPFWMFRMFGFRMVGTRTERL